MFLIGFSYLYSFLYSYEILCLTSAMFLYILQVTFEERLFRKYKLKPAQLAGYEGMFGIVFASIVVLVTNNMSCSNNYRQDPSILNCTYGKLDNFHWFFQYFISTLGDFFVVLAYIMLTTVSTYASYLIIKKISAITKVLSDCNSLFLNQITLMIAEQISFSWYYILYYAICIKGTLLFCEIIVYPCFGFNNKKGHGFRNLNNLACQQQYDQNQNDLLYHQYNNLGDLNQNLNSAGGNNIVALIQNKEGDNQLRQPLLKEINLQPNYQQPRPSNIYNQIGIIKEEQKEQPQYYPSKASNQNNQYPNQQQRLSQNLVNQPQNQSLSYKDYATIKQILKEIKSMQFEKLVQIKQIIALIEDVDKKIPLSEHCLKLKIAKILQQTATVLTKNYSNTIKMKMTKLIQEDQYSDVCKINEMRYIQDRMYFLVNNNNITTNCIKEIINWIEKDLQPGELEKASQNLQQINDQFLNEQQKNQQQSDSNWGEKYYVLQQKIKSY
ncbi:hypothetical protein ABPG74_007215 [Tetrahymena malaccensis]